MNICVIPARGNSARIKHKNRRLFHGKEIIVYSIETARESGLFDAICVSTDDPETIQIAKDYSCYVHLRSSAYLCGPDAGTQEVVQDCLSSMTSGEYKYACCVYATAPLMTAADLIAGYLELFRNPCRYVFVDGWYYWGRSEEFLKRPEITADNCKRMSLPRDWVDINFEDDWKRAERLYDATHPVIDGVRMAPGPSWSGTIEEAIQLAKCSHDYELQNEGHALPEMVHFRCRKCGESLPT